MFVYSQRRLKFFPSILTVYFRVHFLWALQWSNILLFSKHSNIMEEFSGIKKKKSRSPQQIQMQRDLKKTNLLTFKTFKYICVCVHIYEYILKIYIYLYIFKHM